MRAIINNNNKSDAKQLIISLNLSFDFVSLSKSAAKSFYFAHCWKVGLLMGSECLLSFREEKFDYKKTFNFLFL